MNASALRADLRAQPWAWDFFQALRVLEASEPRRKRLGRSAHPSEDAWRLGQDAFVEFAPAPLVGLEEGAAAPLLLVAFLGMFGPDGPLPMHLTEFARDRKRNHRDPTMLRFVDIFHHRLLSLFYRAWADARPTVSFDRPHEDRFGTHLASLAGLGADSLRGRDAMPDLAKLHFAGHLACQTRHPDGLAAILRAFFRMPVEVECFVGTWLAVSRGDRTRLGVGRANGLVGAGAMLGESAWSRQAKFRLRFGPLSLEDYERLLPGGDSFRRLVAIVRNYAGDVLLWDVNLVLRRDEVPPISLARQGRLGWTSWVATAPPVADAADLLLDASADSMSRGIETGLN